MSSIWLEPIDEIQRLAFEYREPFVTEAFDKDWAARNKINADHSLLDASTGGKVQYYPFVHSFYQMIPPDTYFAEHPEYFSPIDGKRRVERGQLCLTNPDVLKPGSEWRITGGGPVLVNRFPDQQAERASLTWTAEGPYRVTLALWSKRRAGSRRGAATGCRLRLAAVARHFK